MSISSYIFLRGFSSTTIEKMEVPAETLPVPGATALVATIPVPASPSGGANEIPTGSIPPSSFAPDSVKLPAFSPATNTDGKTSSNFQGR